MARKKKLLSRDEVVMLVHKAHTGDIEARNQIIEKNMGLIYKTAQKIKFNPSCIDKEDLHQQGVLGLVRAISKFDPDRGYQFSTYATWWIRQSMQRYVEKVGSTITRPTYVHSNLNKIRSISDRVYLETGREPSVEEIARESDFKEGKVKRLLGSTACNSISINEPIGEGSTIEDLLSIEGFERNIQLKVYIQNFMKPKSEGGVLTDRERIIVYETFWNGKNSGELQYDERIFGRKNRISRQHICSILSKALSKLKKAMTEANKN